METSTHVPHVLARKSSSIRRSSRLMFPVVRVRATKSCSRAKGTRVLIGNPETSFFACGVAPRRAGGDARRVVCIGRKRRLAGAQGRHAARVRTDYQGRGHATVRASNLVWRPVHRI